MRSSTIAAIASEGQIVEVFHDGAWREIPGLEGFNHSGTEAPTRDIITTSGEPGQRSGSPRVGTVECGAYLIPQHEIWQDLRAAHLNSETRRFRLITKEVEQHNPGAVATETAAIAADGEVTFAGADRPDIKGEAIGPGSAIIIGANAHVISRVTDAGAVYVAKPAAAVAAAMYRIEIPAVRIGPFIADVTKAAEIGSELEADMKTALMLAPLASLPAAEIVVGGQSAAQGSDGAVGQAPANPPANPPQGGARGGAQGGGGGQGGGK